MAIFPDEPDPKMRKRVSDLPKTIDSFEQLSFCEEALIIYFVLDTISGYQWKGYKTGAFRQRIPPERRVPGIMYD